MLPGTALNLIPTAPPANRTEKGANNWAWWPAGSLRGKPAAAGIYGAGLAGSGSEGRRISSWMGWQSRWAQIEPITSWRRSQVSLGRQHRPGAQGPRIKHVVSSRALLRGRHLRPAAVSINRRRACSQILTTPGPRIGTSKLGIVQLAGRLPWPREKESPAATLKTTFAGFCRSTRRGRRRDDNDGARWISCGGSQMTRNLVGQVSPPRQAARGLTRVRPVASALGGAASRAAFLFKRPGFSGSLREQLPIAAEPGHQAGTGTQHVRVNISWTLSARGRSAGFPGFKAWLRACSGVQGLPLLACSASKAQAAPSGSSVLTPGWRSTMGGRWTAPCVSDYQVRRLSAGLRRKVSIDRSGQGAGGAARQDRW